MLLLVDKRKGPTQKGLHDLVKPLERLGFEVAETILPYGDVAFEGRGANNDIVDIGIELKTLGDAIGSLRSGRLSGHQLPGLLGPKGAYDHCWLVVEGYWRTNAAGHILVYKGKKLGWRPIHGGMSADELMKKVLTLELCGGFHVRYTNTRQDTLQFIQTLVRWWSDKSLDQHTSHLTPHTKPLGFLPVSEFRQAVMKWPGIGLKASLAVESCFKGSIKKAVSASVDEWAKIMTTDKQGRTKRLGIATAEKIVAFVNG